MHIASCKLCRHHQRSGSRLSCIHGRPWRLMAGQSRLKKEQSFYLRLRPHLTSPAITTPMLQTVAAPAWRAGHTQQQGWLAH